MKNKGIIIVVAILVLVAAGFVAARFLSLEDSWVCLEGEWVKHGNPSGPAPETGCGPSADTLQEVNGINFIVIKDFAYSPDIVTVQKGTTVTWKNDDSVVHNVISLNDFPGFSSPLMNLGDSYSFTFNEVGMYGYYCSIHPSMRGTVNVVE